MHGSFSLFYCTGMCVAEKGVYGFTRGSHSLVYGSGGHLVHGGGKAHTGGATAVLFFWFVVFNEV